MSIWCSWEDIGTDVLTILTERDGKPCLEAVGDQPEPKRGEVRSYAVGFSNHYPTRDGEYEQPANVGISSIPRWCIPGHRNEEGQDDYDMLGEWVRLDLFTAEHSFKDGGKPTGRYLNAAVVMDVEAARALYHDLGDWLMRPKAQPQTEETQP